MADQARGRVEDSPPLDLAETVVLQRRPRAGQVDDDVGDPERGVQLQRPLRVDDLVVIDAPLAEVRLRRATVLGRDAERLAGGLELGGQVDQVEDVGHVDPALGNGDDQPAAAVAEVGLDDHGVGRLGLVLGEDVHAGDAQVAAPFLDLDDDVRRPHEDDVEPGMAAMVASYCRSLARRTL